MTLIWITIVDPQKNRKTNKKKIGILGGAFDPVHHGHLMLAADSLNLFFLDEVIFVPTKISPHKNILDGASVADRVRMLELAISDEKRFSYSLVEIDRSGVSYMVDTLNILRKIYDPEVYDFFLLLGMDNLVDFHNWRKYQNILQIAKLIVFNRPHILLDSHSLDRLTLAYAPLFLSNPIIEISSSDIRKRVREGKNIRYYVPNLVADYVAFNNIYS